MKIDAKLYHFIILLILCIFAAGFLLCMADRIEAQMKDDVRAAGEAAEVYEVGGRIEERRRPR